MSISTVIAFLFLLPGYISFLLVKQFTVGFGRKSGNFDKTLISLLFDIPILLITIKIFNYAFLSKLFGLEKYTFNSFHTFNEFKTVVYSDINLLALLFFISITVSIIIGVIWTIILKSFSLLPKIAIIMLGLISTKKRSVNILTYYHTIWKQDFVKPPEPIPAKVYELSSGNIINEGFIEEVSDDLESDLEIKFCDLETFKELERQNIFNEISFTYINKAKDIKIIVYDQGEYIKFKSHIGEEEINK